MTTGLTLPCYHFCYELQCSLFLAIPWCRVNWHHIGHLKMSIGWKRVNFCSKSNRDRRYDWREVLNCCTLTEKYSPCKIRQHRLGVELPREREGWLSSWQNSDFVLITTFFFSMVDVFQNFVMAPFKNSSTLDDLTRVFSWDWLTWEKIKSSRGWWKLQRFCLLLTTWRPLLLCTGNDVTTYLVKTLMPLEMK